MFEQSHPMPRGGAAFARPPKKPPLLKTIVASCFIGLLYFLAVKR